MIERARRFCRTDTQKHPAKSGITPALSSALRAFFYSLRCSASLRFSLPASQLSIPYDKVSHLHTPSSHFEIFPALSHKEISHSVIFFIVRLYGAERRHFPLAAGGFSCPAHLASLDPLLGSSALAPPAPPRGLFPLNATSGHLRMAHPLTGTGHPCSGHPRVRADFLHWLGYTQLLPPRPPPRGSPGSRRGNM